MDWIYAISLTMAIICFFIPIVLSNVNAATFAPALFFIVITIASCTQMLDENNRFLSVEETVLLIKNSEICVRNKIENHVLVQNKKINLLIISEFESFCKLESFSNNEISNISNSLGLSE